MTEQTEGKQRVIVCVNRILFFVLILWLAFFQPAWQVRADVPVKFFLSVFLFFLAAQQRRRGCLFQLQDWPLWLFLATLASGVVHASQPAVAVRTYIFLASYLFLLFYIGKSVGHCLQSAFWICLCIALFSGVLSVLGILEVLFQKNFWVSEFLSEYRAYQRHLKVFLPVTTQIHRTSFASFLLLTLPFSLYLAGSLSTRTRLFGAAFFSLAVAALLLSLSRSAMLGLLVFVFCYLCLLGKKKEVFVFSGCVFVFLVAASWLPYPFRHFSFYGIFYQFGGLCSAYRMQRLEMGFNMLAEYPLFGIGWQHFRIHFGDFFQGIRSVSPDKQIADNMYVTLLAESGLSGVIGFFIFAASRIKQGIERIRSAVTMKKRQVISLMLAVFVAALANMAGYEFFYWYVPYMLWGLIAGFVSAEWKEQDEPVSKAF